MRQLTQPLTVRQVSRRSQIPFEKCRQVVRRMVRAGYMNCLNASARRSRVYALTASGRTARQTLIREARVSRVTPVPPTINWQLYGWVCFRHRAAILMTLHEPMQPAAIKRRARSRDPTLRMSANNVRDVIRLFRAHGIVRAVRVRHSVHLRYELTDVGHVLQSLLMAAEVSA